MSDARRFNQGRPRIALEDRAGPTYSDYADQSRRKPFRREYDALIDYHLEHPTSSQKERATFFGRSVGWVNIVENSDMFKARFAARREELNHLMSHVIAHKAANAVAASLDISLEIINTKRTAIPFAQLTDFQDKTLGRLGYGASRPAATVVVQQNNGAPATRTPITQDDLRRAQERMRQNEAAIAAAPLLEHEAQSAFPVRRDYAPPIIADPLAEGEEENA